MNSSKHTSANQLCLPDQAHIMPIRVLTKEADTQLRRREDCKNFGKANRRNMAGNNISRHILRVQNFEAPLTEDTASIRQGHELRASRKFKQGASSYQPLSSRILLDFLSGKVDSCLREAVLLSALNRSAWTRHRRGKIRSYSSPPPPFFLFKTLKDRR